MLLSRSLTVMVLAATLVSVAGCDRETPDAAQPQSASSAPADAPGSPAKAGSGEKSAFTGTLDTSHRGAQMPDITLTDPAGKSLRLADLVGTPLLVNLWATWCAPCVLEMPMLDELAVTHDGRLRVLTISQDMEGAAKVGPFFAQKNFRKLEPWLDTANDLGFHYNTGVLPTTVLYDAQGREVWRMVGAYDWADARTATMLGEILKGK